MYVCMSTCYSAPSRFLLRGTHDYSPDTESEFHAEAHEQLRVKDLPGVPTRRLEVDSKPQPSGCKAPNIPLHHHAPQMLGSCQQRYQCIRFYIGLWRENLWGRGEPMSSTLAGFREHPAKYMLSLRRMALNKHLYALTEVAAAHGVGGWRRPPTYICEWLEMQ